MYTEETQNRPIVDIEKFLTELTQTKSAAQFILNDYRNEKWLLEIGLIDQIQFDTYLHELTNRVKNLRNETEDIEESDQIPKASVFLSYNQVNMETALEIQREFAQYGVRVKMDVSDVSAGQSIEDFIIKQTKENEAVLLLVSRESFSSAWVSYESTMAIFNQKLTNKPIIPLHICDFYSPKFSYQVHIELKQKIDKIIEEIQAHERGGFKTMHLQERKNQLDNALHRLPDIFSMLTKTAGYSITENNFKSNIKRIADQILGIIRS